jgi:NADH-quinone oxidoreductase subunit H
VAGFNIEYSGLKFGMYYVADFLHAFTSAMIFSTLFLGGWNGPGAEQVPALGFLYLLIKTAAVYLLTVTIRFTVPRLRIDQMMEFAWKYLTPLALASLLVTALVDKAAPPGQGLLRIALLLATNFVLFLIADRLVTLYRKHTEKERKVVSENRTVPVAIRKTVVDEPEVNT